MSGARPTLSNEETQPLSILPPAPAGAALHSLWFAVQARPWNSLAVLPAGPGENALSVANALFDVGALVSGGPMRMLDARTVSLANSASFIVNMSSLVSAPGERRTGGPQRVVVVLSSVLDEMAGVPIILSADAALLTLTLGKTSLDAARRTLELIGAQRVLGCILVTPGT